MPTTNTKTEALLIAMLLFTTACAHANVEPTDGPRTKIRFVSLKTSGDDVFVHSLTMEK